MNIEKSSAAAAGFERPPEFLGGSQITKEDYLLMHKKDKCGRALMALAFSLIVTGVRCSSGINSKSDPGITGSSFVTRWNTDVTGDNVETNTDQIRLPLSASGAYDFVVSWGDGNTERITRHNQADHTLSLIHI